MAEINRVDDSIQNYGYDASAEHFTSIKDYILDDGINLNPTDKQVYAQLMKYTHKDQLVAFPSRQTLSRFLGVSDRTIDKSIKKLEEIELIKVKREKKPNGENKVNTYILNPIGIPQKVIDGANICRDKKKYDEYLKNKSTNKKIAAAPEITKEQIVELKEIGVTLGKKYVLNKKDIEVLVEKNAIEHVFGVNSGKVKTKAKSKTHHLKCYLFFVRAFHDIPNAEEIEALDSYTLKYSPEVITEAMKMGGITPAATEDYKHFLIRASKKVNGTNKYFAQKNYNGDNKPKNNSKIINNQNVSDYDYDEDAYLFNGGE